MNDLGKKIRIITGGQTGVDRTALDWAINHRVPHGGWCPLGRTAEDGIIPMRYKLNETSLEDPRQRTEWNVRDSDGTVIFLASGEPTGGTAFAQTCCKLTQKPCLILRKNHETLDHAKQLTTFIEQNEITLLNIAGPRSSEEPKLFSFVTDVLDRVFTLKSSLPRKN